MFEGTITYNVIREFYGKTYHMNFKKIVCSVAQNYYKEDFWADKKNKYFTRIFDFENWCLYQISYRHKTVQKSKISEYLESNIEKSKIEESRTLYELTYNIDFGFKGTSKYTYKTDSGIFIEPQIAKYIRICSQIPYGNNEVSSYFKEEPNFKYRSTKEYKLVGYHKKKIASLKSELGIFRDFEILTDRINRIEYDKLWGKKIWRLKFEKRIVDFYQNILKFDLTEIERKNIGSFSTIHMGLLKEDEYNTIQKQLRIHEKEYDQ